MCWNGATSTERTRRTAERDIRVLKMVSAYKGKYYSYFRGFEFVVGETYKEDIEKPDYCGDVSKGMHSYMADAVKFKTEKNNSDQWSFWVCTEEQGMFEFYLFRDCIVSTYERGAMCVGNTCICEFTIPKGAEYYLNRFGEVVSSSITFTKVLLEITDDTEEMRKKIEGIS